MEQDGQLLDVLDVVDEDTYQTNNKVMMKATPTMKAIPTTKATCTMKATHTTKAKINEYPSYPHTSGRMGATAKDCNHRCRSFLVVVVACVAFGV